MACDTSSVRVFLSLGSNLGNREENIRIAVDRLRIILDRIMVSSMYETEPLYVIDQPFFLNAVVAGYVTIGCRQLLSKAQSIESAMGRGFRNKGTKEPRLIDIDILLYGMLSMNESDLVIPHPGIKERMFVLVPLLEIEPSASEPSSGKLYSGLIQYVKDQKVRLFHTCDNKDNLL